MKINIGITCAALAITAMFIVTPARADKPVVTTTSGNFTLGPDSCIGEAVDFTYTETNSSSVSVQNGIAHVNNHSQFDAIGVGETTGNSYSIHGTENEVENIDLDPTTESGEESFDVTENIISQGGAPNEQIKMREHITVNADGTVTVSRDNFSDNCTG